MIFFIGLETFLVSLVTTFLVKTFAAKLGLMQVPNHRSSHTKTTPHGGGLGIVAGTVFFTLCLLWKNPTQYKLYSFTIALALFIALKGLLDDIYQLSAQLRFLIQGLISFLLIVAIQNLPIPGFEPIANLSSVSTTALILLASIWWLNLFNFMDGIDGLAASEAIFMLLSAAGLILAFKPELVFSNIWQTMIYLTIAILGFLVFNWAPAKVFMGDVGSNFLAFMLLTLALTTISLHWLNYATWGILACLFVTDATITLLRRILTHQNWLEGHRSHAYQKLARRWDSHRKATCVSIAVNIFWLLPLAYGATYFPDKSLWFLLIAYYPIIIIVWKLGAGKADNQ